MFFLKELPTEKMLQRYADKFPEMNREKTAEALWMMRKASILIRDLEAYFRQYELSLTRFLILIVLDREPEAEAFTISDLVQRLDVSKPVITNTLKSIAQKNWVSISQCKADSRSKSICLTEEGRELLYKVLPGYYQTINQQMED